MSDPTSPTPDPPSEPASLPAVTGPSSISFQLLQIDITQTILVPPEYLRAYRELDEGLATKIVDHTLKMQEQFAKELFTQQAHVRELETEEAKQLFKLATQDQKAEIDDKAKLRRIHERGQWLAAVITFGGFVPVGLALFTNNPTAAIWLGCSMVVALAGVFLFGRLMPKSVPSEPPPPNEPTPP